MNLPDMQSITLLNARSQKKLLRALFGKTEEMRECERSFLVQAMTELFPNVCL